MSIFDECQAMGTTDPDCMTLSPLPDYAVDVGSTTCLHFVMFDSGDLGDAAKRIQVWWRKGNQEAHRRQCVRGAAHPWAQAGKAVGGDKPMHFDIFDLDDLAEDAMKIQAAWRNHAEALRSTRVAKIQKVFSCNVRDLSMSQDKHETQTKVKVAAHKPSDLNRPRQPGSSSASVKKAFPAKQTNGSFKDKEQPHMSGPLPKGPTQQQPPGIAKHRKHAASRPHIENTRKFLPPKSAGDCLTRRTREIRPSWRP